MLTWDGSVLSVHDTRCTLVGPSCLHGQMWRQHSNASVRANSSSTARSCRRGFREARPRSGAWRVACMQHGSTRLCASHRRVTVRASVSLETLWTRGSFACCGVYCAGAGYGAGVCAVRPIFTSMDDSTSTAVMVRLPRLGALRLRLGSLKLVDM